MRCRLWVDSARPEQVGLARRLVQTVAGHTGLSDGRVDDAVLALSEALTNAVRAHTRVGCSEHILVTFGVADDAFEISVEDRGDGFDPLHGHTPVWDDGLEETGRGIPLMWALADEAAVKSADGTSIQLRFRLAGSDSPDVGADHAPPPSLRVSAAFSGSLADVAGALGNGLTGNGSAGKNGALA